MKISIIVSVIILAMVSMGMADGFIGTFTGTIDGQRYDLTMERHPDGYYDGTLSGGGQTTVLRGFRQDNQLIGSVLVEGQQSPFIARVQADGGLYFQDQNGDSVVFQPMSASSSAGQGDQAPAQSASGKRSVYINRVKLKDETL